MFGYNFLPPQQRGGLQFLLKNQVFLISLNGLFDKKKRKETGCDAPVGISGRVLGLVLACVPADFQGRIAKDRPLFDCLTVGLVCHPWECRQIFRHRSSPDIS